MILLTNDDGVNSYGLMALYEKLKSRFDVVVLAPSSEKSATGHAITIFKPMIMKKIEDRIFSLTGSPVDCIKVALFGNWGWKIDLVVSGMNPSPNLGYDTFYSGTVAAAREAAISGIRGIAFSIDGYTLEKHYEDASSIAFRIVEKLADVKFPEKTFVNVNIPNLPIDKIKGVKMTVLSTRIYRESIVKKRINEDTYEVTLTGDHPSAVEEDGTDYKAVKDGYVSITPIKLLNDESHKPEKWNFLSQIERINLSFQST